MRGIRPQADNRDWTPMHGHVAHLRGCEPVGCHLSILLGPERQVILFATSSDFTDVPLTPQTHLLVFSGPTRRTSLPLAT